LPFSTPDGTQSMGVPKQITISVISCCVKCLDDCCEDREKCLNLLTNYLNPNLPFSSTRVCCPEGQQCSERHEGQSVGRCCPEGQTCCPGLGCSGDYLLTNACYPKEGLNPMPYCPDGFKLDYNPSGPSACICDNSCSCWERWDATLSQGRDICEGL
jgi:hypothetical protein